MFEAYTHSQVIGVGFLVAAGALSLLSAGSLFVFIVIKAVKTKDATDANFFRTPLAAYFGCLLFSDMIEGVASILNVSWVVHRGVKEGTLCTAQAALKQFGHLGTAMWSLIIACHTFLLLFYGKRFGRWVLYITLAGVWLFVVLLVLLGPLASAKAERGPFWGITGSWCWIEETYPIERHLLQYDYMFISAFGSLILYSLVILRLRGNILVVGWRFFFRRCSTSKPDMDSPPEYQAGVDSNSLLFCNPGQPSPQVLRVARHMMLYPLAYTILVTPVATTRFMSFSGRRVSAEVIIAAATLLMLNGFVDTVLFLATRRVVVSNVLSSIRLPSFRRQSITGDNLGAELRSKRASKHPVVLHSTGEGPHIFVNVERETDGDVPKSPASSYSPQRRSSQLHRQHRSFGPYDMLTTSLDEGLSTKKRASSVSPPLIRIPAKRGVTWDNEPASEVRPGTASTTIGEEAEKHAVQDPQYPPPAVFAENASQSRRPEIHLTLPPLNTSSPINSQSERYNDRVYDHPYASPVVRSVYPGDRKSVV